MLLYVYVGCFLVKFTYASSICLFGCRTAIVACDFCWCCFCYCYCYSLSHSHRLTLRTQHSFCRLSVPNQVANLKLNFKLFVICKAAQFACRKLNTYTCRIDVNACRFALKRAHTTAICAIKSMWIYLIDANKNGGWRGKDRKKNNFKTCSWKQNQTQLQSDCLASE